MASLVDVIAYICAHDPRKRDLTRGRLTKLVYLADWRHVLQTGRPMTSITWRVYTYGPDADDVWEAVQNRPDLFEVRPARTLLGNVKDVVRVVGPAFRPRLDAEEQRAIDHVLKVAGRLSPDEFLRLVRSTYPALTQPKYEPLDLPTLARRYREEFPVTVGPRGEA